MEITKNSNPVSFKNQEISSLKSQISDLEEQIVDYEKAIPETLKKLEERNKQMTMLLEILGRIPWDKKHQQYIKPLVFIAVNLDIGTKGGLFAACNKIVENNLFESVAAQDYINNFGSSDRKERVENYELHTCLIQKCDLLLREALKNLEKPMQKISRAGLGNVDIEIPDRDFKFDGIHIYFYSLELPKWTEALIIVGEVKTYQSMDMHPDDINNIIYTKHKATFIY